MIERNQRIMQRPTIYLRQDIFVYMYGVRNQSSGKGSMYKVKRNEIKM